MWLFSQFSTHVVPSLVRIGLGFGIAVVAGVALGIPIGLSELDAEARDAAHRVLAGDAAARAAADLDRPAERHRQQAEGRLHRLLLHVPGPPEHDRGRAQHRPDARRHGTLLPHPAARSGSGGSSCQGRCRRSWPGCGRASALAVIMMVLAEYFSSTSGVGYVLLISKNTFEMEHVTEPVAFRRSELFLALATTAAVLIFDVLYGIAVAVALSILELLERIARPHDGILGYVPGLAGMHDIDDYATGRQVPGLLVYRYDAPLFFANAEDFKRRALASVDAADPPVEWFLLNAEANVEVDLTAVDALEEVRRTLAERGIVFALARVKSDLRVVLEPTGFIDRIGEDRVFMTLPTAVSAYQQWYAARHHGNAPSVEA